MSQAMTGVRIEGSSDIRELRVQLPTALNFRKRIVEGGDQGWQFDSRNFYQFHLDTGGLRPGVYLLRVKGRSYDAARRVLVLK